MTKKERALACVELLKAEFPDDLCSLTYEDPYQLLVAVRLSAQCTDARVNLVTPALFEKYPTPVEMAAADVEDVEELIRSTGFFRTKARDLVIMANQILDGFDGKVPSTIEELTSLQGVGRKTANLIAGDIYGMPGAVVTDPTPFASPTASGSSTPKTRRRWSSRSASSCRRKSPTTSATAACSTAVPPAPPGKRTASAAA